MEIAIGFALGAVTFGVGILAGFRLGRLGGDDVPRLSLPTKVHGYFPTQEEMGDASDSQREA